MSRRTLVGTILVATVALVTGGIAWACPFCSAVSQTFSEEFAAQDVAVLAVRVVTAEDDSAGEPPATEDDTGPADEQAAPLGAGAPPKVKFKIVHILKGADVLGATREIEVLYFGAADSGKSFYLTGNDPQNLMWSSPVPVSERAAEYLKTLPSLPKEGPDRLAYFQDFFEDEDEMLARDAYDEFAKAPYASVKGLKDRIHRDKLLAWLKDPAVSASRRRLYLTMLATCGRKEDADFLETLIRSETRESKSALDAAIAAYLTLKGPDGMALIEDLYLKKAPDWEFQEEYDQYVEAQRNLLKEERENNPDAAGQQPDPIADAARIAAGWKGPKPPRKPEYTDTYAAIMALRFHGQEEQVIPKERLLEGLRCMLDRPDLADLVIPDLARWNDWSAMEKLVTLFKEADKDNSWVKVPVLNYLRACPLPEAKARLDELAKLDPESMKRASSFFPFTAPGSGGAPLVAAADAAAPVDDTAQTNDGSAAADATETPASDSAAADDSPVDSPVGADATADLDISDPPTTDASGANSQIPNPQSQIPDETAAAGNPVSAVGARAADKPSEPANPYFVVAIPAVAAAFLFFLYLFILRGSRRRTAA